MLDDGPVGRDQVTQHRLRGHPVVQHPYDVGQKTPDGLLRGENEIHPPPLTDQGDPAQSRTAHCPHAHHALEPITEY
ncbi:hypothetical protein GCM10017750_36020 [Streptomyces racemochromogenes]